MEKLIDPADIAQMWAENETLAAIAAHKERAKNVIGTVPKGTCHYCDQPVGQGELYCDDECQHDHVEEQTKLERLRRITNV